MSPSRTALILRAAGLASLLALLFACGLPAFVPAWAAPHVQPPARPALTLPQSLPALPGSRISVPINFDPAGRQVASVGFSLDFDQSCLAFDPTDADGDGRPDAVQVRAPAGYFLWVFYNSADTAGELDIALADLMPPMIPLSAGVLLEIGFTATCAPPAPEAAVEAALLFAPSLAPSYGSPLGFGIDGGAPQPGSVLIAYTFEPTATPTPTSTLTPLPTGWPTPTVAPTPTATTRPTDVPTAAPTPTSTYWPTNPPPDQSTPTATPLAPTPTAPVPGAGEIHQLHIPQIFGGDPQQP